MEQDRILQADTIAAIATAQGEGGIAVIRLSGSNAFSLFQKAFQPVGTGKESSHKLLYGHVFDEDGSLIDEAMGVFMKAPHSYTREDVCEIHCHGGRISAKRTLSRLLSFGARLAEPGEFTKRAFLNGRLDLSEAEAVMALIRADSEASARAAVRQLSGGVSSFARRQIDNLTALLSLIEAGNDFPEEMEEQATAEKVLEGISEVRNALSGAVDERAAKIVREGISVVLIGKPNVGKSSLMNALLQSDRAIVTDLPGTTRDVLTERITINGVLVEISDTAGQRETEDQVEKIGVLRAKEAEAEADVVIMVLDSSAPLDLEDEKLLKELDERSIIVKNKTDLENSMSKLVLDTTRQSIDVCALTGEGIDELLGRIAELCEVQGAGDQQMTAQRHIESARQTISCLDQATTTINEGLPIDLAAVELMDALSHLTEITGESASESVIDRIFKDFCVGK